MFGLRCKLSFFVSIIVPPQLDSSHRQGFMSSQEHNQPCRWLVLDPHSPIKKASKESLFLSDIASVHPLPSLQCCRGGAQLVAFDPKQSSIHTHFTHTLPLPLSLSLYLTNSSVLKLQKPWVLPLPGCRLVRLDYRGTSVSRNRTLEPTTGGADRANRMTFPPINQGTMPIC